MSSPKVLKPVKHVFCLLRERMLSSTCDVTAQSLAPSGVGSLSKRLEATMKEFQVRYPALCACAHPWLLTYVVALLAPCGCVRCLQDGVRVRYKELLFSAVNSMKANHLRNRALEIAKGVECVSFLPRVYTALMLTEKVSSLPSSTRVGTPTCFSPGVGGGADGGGGGDGGGFFAGAGNGAGAAGAGSARSATLDRLNAAARCGGDRISSLLFGAQVRPRNSA
jgi:hypothetical protein